MALKGKLIAGIVAAAAVAGGTAIGYSLGKGGMAEGNARAYQTAEKLVPQDGGDTIIEISDDGLLRILLKRDVSSGTADYSLTASCTNIAEGLKFKGGNFFYIDTDHDIWDDSAQKDFPSQHDGLVDRISPMSYEGFFENRTNHSSYIRYLDFEENQPLFEEGDRLMEEMRNTLNQKVNIELMFI